MSSMAQQVGRSIRYMRAFRAYQEESAHNLMDIADASAKQLKAVNLCLDLAYVTRTELSRSESAKDLIEAIEEITITNREIIENITKATASMRRLSEQLDRIEDLS